MANKPTDVEEQINILSHRGLNIDYPDEIVKNYLLSIGYYRLGFYWYYLEKEHDTHRFKDNVSFSDIIAIYDFDKNLRCVLLNYLYEIELDLRTKLIYYVSNFYNNPVWYKDHTIIDKKFRHPKYEGLKEKNKVISKHHSKYPEDKYAPAWKVLEYYTFGQIISLFGYLKNKNLKEKISNCYHIKSVKVFENYFGTLNFVRNKCSHNEKVYDLTFSEGLMKIPDINFIGQNRSNLISFIQIMHFILKALPNNKHAHFIKQIINEINHFREIIRDHIYQYLVDGIGFDYFVTQDLTNI